MSSLQDRIDLIPCRANYSAPGWFEERDKFIVFFISSWCNWSYSSKSPVQNSWRGKKLNHFFPPSSSDELCLHLWLYSSSSMTILLFINAYLNFDVKAWGLLNREICCIVPHRVHWVLHILKQIQKLSLYNYSNMIGTTLMQWKK